MSRVDRLPEMRWARFAILSLAGLLAPPSSADAEPLWFPARRAFPVGSRPDFSARAIETADLDGDGRLELVAAGGARDEISILCSVGERQFSVPLNRPLDLPVGADLLAVDVDGDGRDELLLLCDRASGAASGNAVLLGSAPGFRLRPRARFDVPGVPVRAITADFDRNSWPDIAIASGAGEGISVLFGTGHGDFARRRAIAFPLPVHDLAAGDVSGDGRPDLLAVAAARTAEAGVYIWRALEGRRFQASRHLFAGRSPASVDAGDVDADGEIDILIGVEDEPGLHVLYGAGSGLRFERVTIPDVYSSAPARLVDIDRDGRLDVVVRGGRAVYRNRGDREFDARRSWGVGGVGTLFACGDLDRDGLVDLAVSGRRDADWDDISVLWGDRAGRMAAATVIEAPGAWWWWRPVDLAAGDFDADGDLDLAVAQQAVRSVADEMVVHENRGDGRFELAARIAVGDPIGSFRLRAIVAEDLDGDGGADLAAAGEGGAILVLLGDRRGEFRRIDRIPFRESGGPLELVAGDLDGDGDIDLATLARSPPLVRILRNPGDGRFASQESLALVGGVGLDLAAATIDPRRGTELLVLQAPARVTRLTVGPAGFRAETILAGLDGGRATSLATGDLQGDGAIDIVLGVEGDCCPRDGGWLALLSGARRGAFDGPRWLRVARSFPRPYVDDVDRDGRADLLLCAAGVDEVLWWRSLEQSGPAEPITLLLEREPLAVTVGDFDGDLVCEVVTASSGSGDVAVLFGQRVGGWPPDGPAEFLRGDVDSSGAVEPADAVDLLLHLFLGAARPACGDAADSDDDGRLTLGDAIYLLRFFLRQGPPLPGPVGRCGPDLSRDALDCARYPPCRPVQGVVPIGPIQ